MLWSSWNYSDESYIVHEGAVWLHNLITFFSQTTDTIFLTRFLLRTLDILHYEQNQESCYEETNCVVFFLHDAGQAI